MKAKRNSSPDVKYEELPWCDRITGTKEQLQSLGLGVGLAFPGEPGGSKRAPLRTQDPRGFPVKITSQYCHQGIYNAYLTFPGWPERPIPKWEQAFPGVKKLDGRSYDEYVGTAVDLVAAGIVRFDQLPGQPGMRKTFVRIFPDETVLSGPLQRNPPHGASKTISRAGEKFYRVIQYLPEDEAEQRYAVEKSIEANWLAQIRALSRPPRLHPGMIFLPLPLAPQKARGHLRLVWSA